MKTSVIQNRFKNKLNKLLEASINQNPKYLIEYLKTSVSFSHRRILSASKLDVFEETIKVECAKELKSEYYKHDPTLNVTSKNRGPLLYSPVIDLCVTPLAINIKTNRRVSIFNQPLTDIRDGFYQQVLCNETIGKLVQKITDTTNENISQIDPHIKLITSPIVDPLYLIGIEIEMGKNMKHLIGDFVNAYILSKVPIVIVPDANLNRVLNLLDYFIVTKKMKCHGIEFIHAVNIVTIEQFDQILDEVISL